MTSKDWDEIVTTLRDLTDVDRAVAAAQRLQDAATADDVPGLLALLKDNSFFVREAAAWPLSDLGQTEALPHLLEALHRGFQEGHDNDGLSAALADLAEMNPHEAATELRKILRTGPRHLHEHAVWLLEFCKGERDA
jgi:HEAT repeat protein